MMRIITVTLLAALLMLTGCRSVRVTADNNKQELETIGNIETTKDSVYEKANNSERDSVSTVTTITVTLNNNGDTVRTDTHYSETKTKTKTETVEKIVEKEKEVIKWQTITKTQTITRTKTYEMTIKQKALMWSGWAFLSILIILMTYGYIKHRQTKAGGI